MSAIAGIIALNKGEISPDTVCDFECVMRVQRHRGPDGTQFSAFRRDGKLQVRARAADVDPLFKPHGLLAYNMLRLNSVTDTLQPFFNGEGTVGVMFDGKIYNLGELRTQMKGCGRQFNSLSDAEVVLQAYMEYGIEQMASVLNGSFVLAIVDMRHHVLHIVADRYGSKPLYYANDGKQLLFSSELKGIIQVRKFERKLDLDACNARLLFARTGCHVMLSGVQLLAPGEILTVRDGKVYSKQYYDLDAYERDEHKFRNANEAVAATEEILHRVVSRQLADKRMGIQLSGGIDSTLLAYYAKQIGKDNFSEAVAIVDGTGDEGEERYIRCVSDQLGLNLHKFQMNEEYFADHYEAMIWHNDAPAYRPYFSCFMRLGELAKQHADVLFCGEGADELTGGYSRFAAGALVPFLGRLNITNGSVKSYTSYAEYAVMAGETIIDFTTQGYDGVQRLLEERMDVFRCGAGTDFTKHLKFEMRECLPEAALRQDKMTMASSIQNRMPFLDNELVDHIMTMNEEYLVRFVDSSPLLLGDNPFQWMQGKWIFKEIVAKQFGRDFAYRKKMIMNLDERSMLTSTRFREIFYDKVLPGIKGRGLFDAKQIQQWFEGAGTIPSRQFTSMWKAIATESFCQMFIDAPGILAKK